MGNPLRYPISLMSFIIRNHDLDLDDDEDIVSSLLQGIRGSFILILRGIRVIMVIVAFGTLVFCMNVSSLLIEMIMVVMTLYGMMLFTPGLFRDMVCTLFPIILLYWCPPLFFLIVLLLPFTDIYRLV